MLDHFIAKNSTALKVNSYCTLAISYCTFCVEKHTILGPGNWLSYESNSRSPHFYHMYPVATLEYFSTRASMHQKVNQGKGQRSRGAESLVGGHRA